MKNKIEIGQKGWKASKKLLKKSTEVRKKVYKPMKIDLSEDAKRFILRPGVYCVRMKMEKGLFESYAYGKKKKGLDEALNRLPVAPKAVQLFKNYLTKELGKVSDLKAVFLYFSTWHNQWMKMLDTEWEHYFVPAHVKEVSEDYVIVEDLKDPERMVDKNLPVKVCQWVAVHGNEICGLISEEDAEELSSIVRGIVRKPRKITLSNIS